MSLTTTFSLSLATVILLSAPVRAQDADLFSGVRPGSVFTSLPESESDRNTTPSRRITKIETVRELLNSAGLDAKISGERRVSLTKEIGKWRFPVLLELTEDELAVRIVFGLSVIEDVSKQLPQKTLLEMMEASQKFSPMLFSYHPQRKRTELSLMVPNRNITAEQLRNRITGLAVVAKDTSPLWTIRTDQSAEPTEDGPPPSESPTTAPTDSLSGRWSASRSTTEAFAVEFVANGTFQLVYINNGQQTRSQGKFTVQDGTLRLQSNDGTTLEGQLTIESTTQFQLRFGTAPALNFIKAS